MGVRPFRRESGSAGRVSIDRGPRSTEIKTALITGGSSGIGLEFARQLLEVGYRVIAASRSAERPEDLRRLKAEHGDRLSVHRLDVGVEASRRGFFEAVSEEVDSLDLLINAARVISGDEQNTSMFGDLDQDELSRTILTNSIAPLMMTERAFPSLKRGTRPAVVNISSLDGSSSLWDRKPVQLREQGSAEHDHQDPVHRVEGRQDPHCLLPPGLGEDVDDSERGRSDGARRVCRWNDAGDRVFGAERQRKVP